MGSRIDLHNKLKELFNDGNVYYQPPENTKMIYPCIRYMKDNVDSKFADDSKYTLTTRYEIIVLDKNPDNKVISKILNLPQTSYGSHYTSDGLNHDVIYIYY